MLKKIIQIIRSSISYIIGIILCTCIGIPFLLVLAATPRRFTFKNRLLFILLAGLYRSIIWSSFIRVTVKGSLDSLRSGESKIVIANHQSAFDIILAGYCMGTRPHFWYYWQKFSKTPILGSFVRRIGVGISQTNARHDARALIQGITLLSENVCNCIIFPEGGRFIDGNVHALLPGFVMLARKTGLPIVPLYMHNVAHAYPPHTFIVYDEPVSVIIGEVVRQQQEESDEEFIARLSSWFNQQVAAYR